MASVASSLTPEVLVGLLADASRRMAFCAIALGDGTLDEVTARCDMSAAGAAKAVARLAAAGLVVDHNGRLQIDERALHQLARQANERPPSTEHDRAPEAHRKVLNAFVVDGRLVSIPVAHAKRQVILDWLAQGFEPGRTYSEAAVNLVLGQRHADTAALRRYLVDDGFLDRANGFYWRCGGTVGDEA